MESHEFFCRVSFGPRGSERYHLCCSPSGPGLDSLTFQRKEKLRNKTGRWRSQKSKINMLRSMGSQVNVIARDPDVPGSSPSKSLQFLPHCGKDLSPTVLIGPQDTSTRIVALVWQRDN